MMSEYPPTPELDKALKLESKIEALRQFFDYLDHNNWDICELGTYNAMIPILKNREILIADCLDLDLDAMELEKRAVLKHLSNG